MSINKIESCQAKTYDKRPILSYSIKKYSKPVATLKGSPSEIPRSMDDEIP